MTNEKRMKLSRIQAYRYMNQEDFNRMDQLLVDLTTNKLMAGKPIDLYFYLTNTGEITLEYDTGSEIVARLYFDVRISKELEERYFDYLLKMELKNNLPF